jgi:hypothetical protein
VKRRFEYGFDFIGKMLGENLRKKVPYRSTVSYNRKNRHQKAVLIFYTFSINKTYITWQKSHDTIPLIEVETHNSYFQQILKARRRIEYRSVSDGSPKMLLLPDSLNKKREKRPSYWP